MKKKKTSKIRYETDKLYRWNLCQKLAKFVNDSSLTEGQIEENIENVLENYQVIKK